jgi:hypothetical protein
LTALFGLHSPFPSSLGCRAQQLDTMRECWIRGINNAPTKGVEATSEKLHQEGVPCDATEPLGLAALVHMFGSHLHHSGLRRHSLARSITCIQLHTESLSFHPVSFSPARPLPASLSFTLALTAHSMGSSGSRCASATWPYTAESRVHLGAADRRIHTGNIWRYILQSYTHSMHLR